MNLQVLVASMNQDKLKLLNKMNIQSDTIIINQCDENDYSELKFRGNNIKFYSFAERGVGLSRNNAFMRATSEICLLADEDVTYIEGYKDIVLGAFKDNPQADMIVFNVPSLNPKRQSHEIKKASKVSWYNCLKYGAVRIAVRTERVRSKNIFFSLLFGGGAKYSSGEDSLFIYDCIRKGLRVYTNPQTIGYVSQETSSWFQGYTDKYFYDKGAFFSAMSANWAWVLGLQFALRHQEMYTGERTLIDVIKLINRGAKDFRRRGLNINC
ncbi:hypothetical protein PA598K_01872 [Paenibacillus sp. 598K]|uniref:glycosyltransferase family 2 protein n=1 Tax=Paenibacillus sp. 598K TaxID=1117987 RepID=UPI000FF95544|nr:glycosyltransferase family 2 protein [Paenibacillus sp. 598K]GBF73570.1 hypothetical protein PA598K_01872 [Paenibacillus sp. 598K]